MTPDTLHVQTRAYPLAHVGLRTPPPGLALTGGADVPVEPGQLSSLAYARRPTLEVDLTASYERLGEVHGTRPVWCRLRVLRSGAALLSLALQHPQRSLVDQDVHELARLDAAVDRAWRERDADLVAAVLGALVDVTVDPWPYLGWAPGDGAQALPRWSAVRYSCHLVHADAPWAADPRVVTPPDALVDASCRMLLPYTHAWGLDPDLEPGELLVHLEPPDVAVAQVSALVAARGEALDILTHLSRAETDQDPLRLRRYLDRVRSTYEQLDAYRHDSGQRARGVYLATRREIGLDDLHERTERLLVQVAESLQAAADARTVALDGKLNRIAGVLTVATGSVFLLDVVDFLRGGQPLAAGWRWATFLAIVLTGAAVVAWVSVATRREMEGVREAGLREGPNRDSF